MYYHNKIEIQIFQPQFWEVYIMKKLQYDRTFYRELGSLMLPLAFQNFMLSAVSAGDAAMLGFVSQDAMAAVSLAAQIQFVENLFLSALVCGATIITAQYWGKGDRLTVQRVFSIILRYALLISAAFFLAALLIPESLMAIFTDEPELIRIGGEYIRIASGSYLLTGISQCYLCILKTTGQAKASSVITSSALALDTVLNAVFILGLSMGARGAALTTVISNAVGLILVLLYAQRSKIVPKELTRVIPALEKDFWHYSLPILVNSMVWGIGTTLYSVIIGHLGSDATAANSIASVVKNLMSCLCRGVGSGGEILLASTLGAGKLDDAKVYGRRLSHISILCGIVSGILVLLCGPVISKFMTLTNAARHDLQIMLYICAAYMIPFAINVVVICGVFSAGGDTFFDAYSVAVTMWLVILPLAAAAAFWWKWPPLIVYLILSMDEAVKIPWVYAHYKKYKWVKNITKEVTP